eukprot:6993260-Prymnesium_polylepis.1
MPREYRGANGKGDPTPVPACVSAGELADVEECLVGRSVTVIERKEDRAAFCDGRIINAMAAAPVLNDGGTLRLGGGMMYEAL